MIKLLKRYLAGELHTTVYWATGLACPILIPLFLIEVVHDWVAMGMRREILLSLGAGPQTAAGGVGLGLASLVALMICWGTINKTIRSHRKP